MPVVLAAVTRLRRDSISTLLWRNSDVGHLNDKIFEFRNYTTGGVITQTAEIYNGLQQSCDHVMVTRIPVSDETGT
jgi:hypothetical protein